MYWKLHGFAYGYTHCSCKNIKWGVIAKTNAFVVFFIYIYQICAWGLWFCVWQDEEPTLNDMKSMNYESNFYAQTILNTIHVYLQLMKSLKVIFNELIHNIENLILRKLAARETIYKCMIHSKQCYIEFCLRVLDGHSDF